MKKLLLSSLMMFAVCSYVNAQNATGSKFQKAGTTTTSVAPTPQKAAVADQTAVSDVKSTNDKGSQAVPAPNDKAAKLRAAKPAEVVVGADGAVAQSDDLTPKERDELKKIEAAKAAAAKKNN